jgi:hypothetical protein
VVTNIDVNQHQIPDPDPDPDPDQVEEDQSVENVAEVTAKVVQEKLEVKKNKHDVNINP